MTITSDVAVGAVLAGGQGRRLGQDKAAVQLDGSTLVERGLSTLQTVFADVVLISPPRKSLNRLAIEIVPDIQPGRGPLGGIVTAIRHAAGRAVFVLACDLPFVSESLIRHVTGSPPAGHETRWAKAGQGVAKVPFWLGRVEPLCALYLPEALVYFEDALDRGALGVQNLLAQLPCEIVKISTELTFAHPDLFLNINRPADLRYAQDRVAQRSSRRS